MRVFAGHLSGQETGGFLSRIIHKLRHMPWLFLSLLCLLSLLGFIMLYSAAGGHMHPWTTPQIQRFALGLAVFFVSALISPRHWVRMAPIVYGLVLICLIILPYVGHISTGARRWIDLGFFRFQPSEMMKVALILSLAAYYQKMSQWSHVPIISLLPPLTMIAIPSWLILRQPDLGTTILVLSGGLLTMFIAGENLWLFIILIVGVIALAPLAWTQLHAYQQERILMFLDPESDPLGRGYQILQSKIAIGSGGMDGKGLLHGSQSHLHFLPEKQTDFIFTMLAEETGFIGVTALFAIYAVVMLLCFLFALNASDTFGRVYIIGFSTLFFLCIFINIAMVSGLLPVVGIPLPFLSYGGSFLVSIMFGFGVIASIRLHGFIEERE